jgi:hypothetical protein
MKMTQVVQENTTNFETMSYLSNFLALEQRIHLYSLSGLEIFRNLQDLGYFAKAMASTWGQR